jgi:hypothetical protein
MRHYLLGTLVMLLCVASICGPTLHLDYLQRKEKKRRALKKEKKKEKKRLKQLALANSHQG